jgi:hypothetical protein
MVHYCKAYPISALRQYQRWADTAVEPPVTTDTSTTGSAVEPILFMHADLTVTDGVLMDECTVFAAVTPDWEAFCRDRLGFSLPEWCDGTATAAD